MRSRKARALDEEARDTAQLMGCQAAFVGPQGLAQIAVGLCECSGEGLTEGVQVEAA